MPEFNFKRFLRESMSDDDFNEEMAYAKRLIAQEVKIDGFSYYKDYVSTIAKEAALIKGRCIFVGSGPVPLTPILLKQNHNISVDALEYNQGAVETSAKLLEVLGVDIHVIHGDAITFAGFGQYGTVMIALEAGPDEKTKKAIFKNIQSQIKPNTQIVVRGSATDGGEGAFPHVEGYVGDFFKVVTKIPVFGDMSTTYVMHCEHCPSKGGVDAGLRPVTPAFGVPGMGQTLSRGQIS